MKRTSIYSTLRVILTVILLASATISYAGSNYKIVERSSKKTPEWLGTAVQGFLVVTVEAPSLAEAQKRALNEVTERIIQSVASNVNVQNNNVASETIINGNVEESSDVYNRTSSIRSANLPFLKGISYSKIYDLYWVKCRNKKTNVEHYEYSIMYPYSRMDQMMLEADFEDYDKEKESQLRSLEESIETFDAVEDIQAAILQLNALAEYFFDNVRLARVKGCKERYNELYKSVSVIGGIVSPGVIECAISVAGRPVRCGVMPKVTSNCASAINAVAVDGKFRITYSTEDCIEEEENSIDVLFRISTKSIEQHYPLNSSMSNEKFSVIPQGTVYLTADSISAADKTITNLNIRLTLNNRGTTDFGVKSLELNVPGLAAPIIIDDIDAVYTSRGVITLKYQVQGTIRVNDTNVTKMLTGHIGLVDPITATVTTTRISLPYSINW